MISIVKKKTLVPIFVKIDLLAQMLQQRDTRRDYGNNFLFYGKKIDVKG